MNAKRYLRGMLGQGWYNFTECLAWAITYRKTPEDWIYRCGETACPEDWKPQVRA